MRVVAKDAMEIRSKVKIWIGVYVFMPRKML
jgi:hypothetical protein